ncbi:hypothetical protein CKY04_10975 [Photorhabdus sp. S8-52]|nr:hypothetical protein CKY05_10890 [Photorhabdus sp. S10-54]RAW99051.1 hypothetical protein CKY03_09995 [Photorhabdus sp. S9-53]RAX03303.1 hypothetical protein CKY04_10975 [Photorhabdus sp. S8-52]
MPGSRKINGKALTGDVSLNAGDVGACWAHSGAISIGGGGTWTTEEFLQWLKSQGAFNYPYWMCKGSWSYASNRTINDTGCGNVCLAGAVIEVMGVDGITTIRVTTPTTTDNNGIPNAQFTYINHGGAYAPGWRRDYNTKNKPSAADVGALPISSILNAQTGSLRINNASNWPHLEFEAANKQLIGIEATLGGRFTIYANDAAVNRRYTLLTPEKNGTLATLDDVFAVNNIPVGAPIPWPLPNVPAGYLACNGQSFNKSLYPQLATAYPSGVLPDLRSEFIRGWDDGRGVDSGRGILSWQPQQVQWHQHVGGHGGRAQGAFGVTNLAGHPGSYRDDAQQTLPFTNNGSDYQGFTNSGAVGNETRPRNIAFNYIVRAA